MEHTKEPWRWEFNEKHKTVSIVGGVPKFDLTVMDFERWGMGGAVPRFRDTAHDGMNVMHRLCDRKDWFAPHAGREHHASWHANVIHPDARRIVACVNACRGLPTDELEQKGLVAAVGTELLEADRQRDELQQQLETERAAWGKKRTELLRNHDAELARRKAAEAQRDELLAVLGSIIDLHDSASRGKQVAETIGKARAVIQKVRGGEC